MGEIARMPASISRIASQQVRETQKFRLVLPKTCARSPEHVLKSTINHGKRRERVLKRHF